MTSESKRRTIHYKLAKIAHSNFTLQEMLECAFASEYKKANTRKQDLTGDCKSFRFINNHSKHGGKLLLCQMVQFEEGLTQMTINMDDEDSESYDLIPFKPEDILSGKQKSIKKAEFLESMLYFGVLDNHVVIMGSAALRSKDLENHLNWFLINLTEQITSSVILSDKPTKNAIRQLEKQPAKKIMIGSDIDFSAEVDGIPISAEEYEQQVTETSKVSWVPKTLGSEIMEFLRKEGKFNHFEFDDAFDFKNFQLKLELSFNRTTTKKGQKVLDQLANSLRHMDKEDVQVELKGGGKLRGDDLKLSTQINVLFKLGKVDESHLYMEIQKWLRSKIQTEDIEQDVLGIAVASE
jgi:hypothetical protein